MLSPKQRDKLRKRFPERITSVDNVLPLEGNERRALIALNSMGNLFEYIDFLERNLTIALHTPEQRSAFLGVSHALD